MIYFILVLLSAVGPLFTPAAIRACQENPLNEIRQNVFSTEMKLGKYVFNRTYISLDYEVIRMIVLFTSN